MGFCVSFVQHQTMFAAAYYITHRFLVIRYVQSPSNNREMHFILFIGNSLNEEKPNKNFMLTNEIENSNLSL